MSQVEWRAGIASFGIGIVTAAVTLGLMWPFMGDPVVAVVEIAAALLTGAAIGGTGYLILSAKW
jgi:hypothetical protein